MTDSIDPSPSAEPSEEDNSEAEAVEVEVSQVGERDSVLAAVLRDQTEKAAVETQAQRVRVRRQGFGLRHVALGFVTATAMWIWFWPPIVLRISPPGPPAVEEEESTLRLVMYFQAQRIEQYLLDTGGVPLALDEAGPVFQGMDYVRLTNSDYRILGQTGCSRGPTPRCVRLTYSSVEPLDVFVGTGASVLDMVAF